jgi:hypothetical protein
VSKTLANNAARFGTRSLSDARAGPVLADEPGLAEDIPVVLFGVRGRLRQRGMVVVLTFAQGLGDAEQAGDGRRMRAGGERRMRLQDRRDLMVQPPAAQRRDPSDRSPEPVSEGSRRVSGSGSGSGSGRGPAASASGTPMWRPRACSTRLCRIRTTPRSCWSSPTPSSSANARPIAAAPPSRSPPRPPFSRHRQHGERVGAQAQQICSKCACRLSAAHRLIPVTDCFSRR